MQPRTLTVYQLKAVIDGILSRTHHVQNTLSLAVPTKELPAALDTWALLLEIENSFESELISKFPRGKQLHDHFSFTPSHYDPSVHPQAWLVPPRVEKKSRNNRERSFSLLPSGQAPEVWGLEQSPLPVITPEERNESQTHKALVFDEETILGDIPGHDDEYRAFEELGFPRSDLTKQLLRSQREVTSTLPPPPGTPLPVGALLYSPSLVSGQELPSRKSGFVWAVVDELFVQALWGLRAMMLALIDISGCLFTNKDHELDQDYIGNSPATDALSALDHMSRWTVADFVPNVKYWKDFPLASCLENPLPKVPESWSKYGLVPNECLFSGRLGRLWRRICQPLPSESIARTNLFRAAFTISQAKRAFHQVPTSFVAESLVKHAATLSKEEQPIPTDDMTDLTRFLRVLFRNYRPHNLIDRIARQEGSTSATNSSSRPEGGQRDEVRHLAQYGANYQDYEGINPMEKYHFRTTYAPDHLIRMVETKNGVREERGLYPLSRAEWVEMIRQPIDYVKAQTSLPSYIRYKMGPEEQLMPFATVQSIVEPLKVRVITAMRGPSTFFAKPVQKSLWDYLSTFPQFELITKPFQESILDGLLDRHNSFFKNEYDDDRDFVSGDYAGATDSLKIAATKAALEEVCSKLRGDDQLLIPHLKSLIDEQLLVYPKASTETVKVPSYAKMKTGQLMGSVISFPFLCVLNFYTYFKTLEPSIQERILNGRMSLKSLPVLINGDDILFRANQVEYSRWLQAVETLGFKLSLGKNFVHKDCLTINSLPITFVGSRPLPPMTPSIVPSGMSWADYEELPEHTFLFRTMSRSIQVHGFANLGLLIGQTKTAKEKDELVPLNGWYAASTSGAMYPVKMSNFFLDYHKGEILQQTKFGNVTLNLYAHPMLGGLGFPIPRGVEVRYDEPQRALAHRLFESAQKVVHSTPSDHPLLPFTYLTLSEKKASLGNRPGHVYTRLAGVGPLGPGEELFADTTVIHSTPLAQSYGDMSEAFLAPMCRLKNSELNRILRGAKHQHHKLHPVEEMHVFPFNIVTFDPNVPVTEKIPDPSPELVPLPTLLELHESYELVQTDSYDTQGKEVWELEVHPLSSILQDPSLLAGLVSPQLSEGIRRDREERRLAASLLLISRANAQEEKESRHRALKLRAQEARYMRRVMGQ